MSKQLFDLGLLTTIDRQALAGYCVTYSRHVAAEKIIAKEGLVINGPRGKQKHPAVLISQDALKLMKSYLIEFGMTPSSRTRIKVGRQDKDNEAAEFFG